MKAKLKALSFKNPFKARACFFILIFGLLGYTHSAKACTLASHDWKLVGYLKLDTGVPLFPVSEADELLMNDYEQVKRVFWINQNAETSTEILKGLLVPFYQSILSGLNLPSYIASGLPDTLSSKDLSAFDWTKTVPMIPITSGRELQKHLALGSKEGYIVIGSDNYKVRVALFADANSKYQCYQLVIIQDGRVRAVQANTKSPSAKESKGLSYLSIIFYGSPLEGQIMSFSLYPIAKTRLFFIQNETLVARLLYEEKLLPRLSTENDPSSYDIPELPD